MILPVYVVVWLVNILAKSQNYNIKMKTPNNMDIRVRRSIDNTLQTIENHHLITDKTIDNIEKKVDLVIRKKRSPSYKNLINNDNYKNWISSQNLTRSGNTYKPNWSDYTQNIARYYTNQNVYNTQNNIANQKSVKNSQNMETPEYYNYQNPNGLNFGGYYGTDDKTNKQKYIINSNNDTQKSLNPSYNQKVTYNTTNGYKYQPSSYNIKTQNPLPAVYYNGTSINNGIFKPGTFSPYNTTNQRNNGVATSSSNDKGNRYSAGNGNRYGTDNGNRYNTGNGDVTTQKTTTTTIKIACIICNIPCPEFMRRIGNICMKDIDYYDE